MAFNFNKRLMYLHLLITGLSLLVFAGRLRLWIAHYLYDYQYHTMILDRIVPVLTAIVLYYFLGTLRRLYISKIALNVDENGIKLNYWFWKRLYPWESIKRAEIRAENVTSYFSRNGIYYDLFLLDKDDQKIVKYSFNNVDAFVEEVSEAINKYVPCEVIKPKGPVYDL